MDEQFDKELSNHIRQVFDNYEHPGADKGWARLRENFPAEEKGNKVAWLWWSSAAAVALVFLSVMLWFNNKAPVTNNTAANKPLLKQQVQPVRKGTVTEVGPARPDNTQPVIANNTAAPTFNKQIEVPSYVAPASKGVSNVSSSQKENTFAGHPQLWQSPSNAVATGTAAINIAQQPTIDSQKVVGNAANQPQIASNIPQGNTTAVLPANTIASTDVANQPSTKRSINDMFKADEDRNMAKLTKQPDKQSAKKVNFSVYAATYFNYAEGSTNQVNAGAGVTSDFRLSKNFKLSTGVSIAQNSLNYTTQAPQAANALANAAPSLRQETLFGTAAVLPVFKNYNASLVGLDIPVNIKYEINPEKTDAYISAGLSSGTFINERYTYKYGYSGGPGAAFANGTGAPQEQSTQNSFSNFYFGKMLNFSFGVGYPVGGNRLVIEPFFKYPLGGVGAQDIRFGSGGVNLKFSFKTQKR